MFRFRNLPVRQKMTLIVILTCSILITLVTAFFMAEKYISYRRNMVSDITSLAQAIGMNSTAAITFRDVNTAEEILTALSVDPDVIAACIFDPDGRLFATYPARQRHADKRTSGQIEEIEKAYAEFSEGHAFSGQHLDLAEPITLVGKHIGHIVIRADLQRLHNRLRWSVLMVLGLITALILATQIVTSRLHQLIAKPLIALVRTMDAVSAEKNYDLRATKYSDDEMGALIDGFNDMLAQIQERDQQLEQHRLQLENLVDQRTKQLVQSNQKLKREMTERKAVQDQLARAQRMEAIGTLASGVAHDLNNILSGIVSYPELLLMRLEPGSSMKKPLETIQTSGKKASAIVQDLLTLARRGVTSTEPVDIRHIIDEYLNSPEFKKLISFHTNVKIETHFAPDLMNIAGSPIHLSKTIMNLVSNAAEAMDDGGTITISLRNQYIDMPIHGYDHVQQGDYVLLKISDDGHGIGSKDLERIFEPFFTKKKMGRSGTGLGMAVVWGTVKDHQGYIDVDSIEGKGTTFYLYFPVTRHMHAFETPVSLEEYFGNGETVLVIDDVKEQREIAVDILTELGYRSDAVSSGEAAIAYLEKQPVDILLLDMIMEPGIDGLETYRRIVQNHPGQRAIIASGFSESDRVKQALNLGVGAYLRKPYTIDNLAKILYNQVHLKN
jgi:signal transduction histidine kinase/ActR/RegA family two-component response regulator